MFHFFSGTEIQLLVNEKAELDHIMSCLSTLGGAFSSLGDQFLHCVSKWLNWQLCLLKLTVLSIFQAEIAGKISAQQFKIALKLGDPMTLLRCQLYYSISLIQCGRVKLSRDIIKSVYVKAKSVPEDHQDKRIISMCLGIWAKLKYCWKRGLTGSFPKENKLFLQI